MIMSDAIRLTPEEIQQYREQLVGDATALKDIDLIEQCDGDLEYATERLARRSNIDILKGDEETFLRKITTQARQLVCHEQVRRDLAPNILGGLVGLFVTSGNAVFVAIATPLAIHIVRETLENFCD
jgi:hypothetical protein